MASEAELKELERKQRELMRTVTPAQRAEIQTQHAIIKGQLKKAPQELPIDKDAKFEAQSPERGGRKSRRRYRGGEGLNLTQYGVEGRKESVVKTPYDKKREEERKWDERNKGLFETKSTAHGVNKTPFNPLNTETGELKMLARSGGRKSKKAQKTRGRRKTRRGGFTKGAIPHGKMCVFPDLSMQSETRTFSSGELVCYMDPGDPTPKSATYIARMNPYVHRIQQAKDDVEVYAPWHLVGKLVDEASGTGAAGQGMGTGSSSGPLLARSMTTGIQGVRGGRR